MRRLLALSLAMALFAIGIACLGTPRPRLSFDPDELPDAHLGEPYSVTISVINNVTPVGNMGIAEGELPAGLEFQHEQDSDSAQIHGTPEHSGEFTFVISAWCLGTSVNGQVGEKQYTLAITE